MDLCLGRDGLRLGCERSLVMVGDSVRSGRNLWMKGLIPRVVQKRVDWLRGLKD